VGKVFNVGSTDPIAILDLAKRIIALTHSDSDIVFVPYEQAYGEGFEDLQRRVPDIRRIQQLLDWTPKLSLDQIILDIADWLQTRRV
jgi:UDP-glucose 4-epimerase